VEARLKPERFCCSASSLNTPLSIYLWGVPEREGPVFMKALGIGFGSLRTLVPEPPGASTLRPTPPYLLPRQSAPIRDALKPALSGPACSCNVRCCYVGGGAGPGFDDVTPGPRAPRSPAPLWALDDLSAFVQAALGPEGSNPVEVVTASVKARSAVVLTKPHDPEKPAAEVGKSPP